MRLLALLLVAACSSSTSTRPPADGPPQPPPAQADTDREGRTPLLAKDDPRFEGPTFKNACATDADCHVGGCSSEVCVAEEAVITACVAHPDQPRGASCGCLSGQCLWYKAAGTQIADASGGVPPAATGGGGGSAQGEPCKDGKCDAGLECVKYYGIAGARGPEFTSCEIRCLKKGTCPEGQECVTIADGPGQVCRPRP
jgi:eight-cysteine-cluster-containing protein